MHILNIIREAGLSVIEFANLLEVSRIAVHNWTAKPPRSKPHKLIQPRVQSALNFLQKLVRDEELPLPDGLDREARKAKIEKLKARLKTYSVA